jgi:hypothetical protein
MSKLVRLYPPAWRDRYGQEFVDLLRERPPNLRDRLDIMRGALDAQLHSRVLLGGPEPAPWTHRLPGLLALSAGLAMSGALISIATGSGGDWGAAESFNGSALMLMLLSLPGDYLAAFGRRIALAIGAIVVSIGAVAATSWWEPFVVVGILAELAALSGLLSMAAIRAGVAPRERWLLLGAAVASPVVVVGAVALLRATTGIVLVPDGSPIAAYAVLPYGLAWLAVGLRMTVRGSPTIIDPPISTSRAGEVPSA